MTDPSTRPPPADRLRVTCDRPRPGIGLIRASGEMDTLGAPVVAGRIEDLCRDCSSVLLDMRLVTFLDARGVHALLEGDRAARRHRGRLIVVGLDDTSRRVLRVCGVERELTLLDVEDGEHVCGVRLPVGDPFDTAGPEQPAAGS